MSYKITKEQVETLVKNELKMALEQHGEFHSLHEAYAVTLEEVEEAELECENVRKWCEGFKSWVFGDAVGEIVSNRVKWVHESAINLACEAIQVAAMAEKTLRFLNGKPDDDVEDDVCNGCLFSKSEHCFAKMIGEKSNCLYHREGGKEEE